MFSAVKRGFWIFAIVILFLFLFLPGFSKLQELRDKNRELGIKIKKLYIENALLQQELGRLANDSVYQERVTREKLGIVRKGEIPIKMVPADEKK